MDIIIGSLKQIGTLLAIESNVNLERVVSSAYRICFNLKVILPGVMLKGVFVSQLYLLLTLNIFLRGHMTLIELACL